MKKEEEIIYDAKFWNPNINEDIVLHKAHFNNFGFDKHVHEDYTIGLIQEGIMDAFLDGRKQKLNKTTIVTVNPDETHACQTQSEIGYKHYSIYLKPSFLKNLSRENFLGEDLYFKKGLFADEILAKRLIDIVTLNENNQSSKIEFECELISSLNNLFLSNGNTTIQKNLSAHDKMIYRAKEFINDNLGLDLQLSDISDELDISKYHFLRLFKEKTFLSPHSYLMLRRIEKAKNTLQKGESLINTTHICGFNDQSHLNRRFKAMTGMTPGNYQKFFK